MLSDLLLCGRTLKTMSNLSRKNYCRTRESSESVEKFTSTNFNSLNVIGSFHIASGEICVKLTSCLSLHRFSIWNIFRSYRRGKYAWKRRENVNASEWKNKLSKFVDRRLVFVFNSFEKPWKIVWLTSSAFFQRLSYWRKILTEVSMRKLNGVQQLRLCYAKRDKISKIQLYNSNPSIHCQDHCN